jgi:AraC-like DNA-binding protein
VICECDPVPSILDVARRNVFERTGCTEHYTDKVGVITGDAPGIGFGFAKVFSKECAEIGFPLGYDDPNFFIRAFHVRTGQTLETLRRPGPP